MRRGHTLTEMLVVLTLLSLITTVAVPRLITGWGRSHGEAALEMARSAIALARARTVSTGLRHQFLLDPNSGEMSVDVRRVDQAGSTAAAAPVGDRVFHEEIPGEVRVIEWEVVPLGGTVAVARSASRIQADAVAFYPEGQTDDATLILEDLQGRRKGLRLDGFTGELRELTPEEMPK